MNPAHTLQNLFLNFPLFKAGSKPEETVLPQCPQCKYVLDRPHSMTCSRCGTAIPLAKGCNGCGKCMNRQGK